MTPAMRDRILGYPPVDFFGAMTGRPQVPSKRVKAKKPLPVRNRRVKLAMATTPYPGISSARRRMLQNSWRSRVFWMTEEILVHYNTSPRAR